MDTLKSPSHFFAVAHGQTVRISAALPQKLLRARTVGLHVPTLFVTGLPTKIVIFLSARLSSVASLRTNPSPSQSAVSVTAPCVHVRAPSACPPTLCVASASSARSKPPYSSFVQGPPPKIAPSPYLTNPGRL